MKLERKEEENVYGNMLLYFLLKLQMEQHKIIFLLHLFHTILFIECGSKIVVCTVRLVHEPGLDSHDSIWVHVYVYQGMQNQVLLHIHEIHAQRGDRICKRNLIVSKKHSRMHIGTRHTKAKNYEGVSSSKSFIFAFSDISRILFFIITHSFSSILMFRLDGNCIVNINGDIHVYPRDSILPYLCISHCKWPKLLMSPFKIFSIFGLYI